MSRVPKVYLRDILDPIRKIERYKARVNQASFKEDELVQDGIIRNLEIIGEAVKQIPGMRMPRHIDFYMHFGGERCR